MSTVRLDDEEWQRVLGILSQAPWNIANPLLMKIGEQLRQQAQSIGDTIRAGNSGQSPEDSMTETIARSARQ